MADITRTKHLNPRRRNRTYPRVIKRAREILLDTGRTAAYRLDRLDEVLALA